MNIVWAAEVRPAAKKLALLALANRCDDEGGKLFQSLDTMAAHVGVERRHMRKLLGEFKETGLLSVEQKGAGGGRGGAPGRTPRYRLHLDRIAELPRITDGRETEGADNPDLSNPDRLDGGVDDKTEGLARIFHERGTG